MKPRKTLQKILSGSRNIRFEDFVALVIAFGFVSKRTRGSHRIYKHPGVSDLLSLQPSKDGKAKSYQMKQLLQLVEEYNLTLEDEDADESQGKQP
jgi:predicted RNA binding protein YcfA (HicA-like mRNA interferase family)